MIEEYKKYAKEGKELYERAKAITDKENITSEDMIALNDIADRLIDNYDYFYLPLFNELPFENALIKEKAEIATEKMKVGIIVILDYLNFKERDKLDELKKYYQEKGMDEYLYTLNDVIEEESRGR